ncbi:DUF4136 domain-containing protein [Paraurantiacibacter namhicola]|uniref:DUF4136 domain-containing protein n=1 Tax=Paraurantiacibacter namhicola TaxID=645517 RepID=A0A1C7DBF1_9SPHN|nr:DUF4136 domain-containing protein [Paraurantiacibacter namhicola]ANU08830.1 hypothetical protein A6F65_02552 [Paraurantiacibacter namhicola]
MFITTTLRKVKLAAAPLALGALAACTTGFNADVSRFQTQLPAPQGQTFAVVADDPALAGGLEFSQYAAFVTEEMSQLGYTPVVDPSDANLLVRFDYGIDNGRERIRSTGAGYGYRDPFFRPWRSYTPVVYRSRRDGRARVAYVPTRAWGYGWHDPFFGGRERVTSYTVFTSGITMKIDDAQSGERLFEGKAQAASTSNRLQYLVPNLVEAMFTDFPGNSGETVRISVKPEDMAAQRR